MKKTTLAIAVSSLCAAAVNAGTVTHEGADLVLKTNGGFQASTTDGEFSFKLGGRIQADYNSYDGVIHQMPGEDGSDFFFRRARIELSGHAGDWGYYMSYNLTDSGSIDMVYTTYTGWGKLAQLSVGQQKEDFGLDDTGSSKWTTAIERSMPSSAFDTGHHLGIKLHGANDLISYSAGVYKNGIDETNELDTAITGRFVVRPYMDGNNLIHLGVGATDRSGSSADYNSRLGVRGGDDGQANRVRARVAGAEGDRRDYNLEAAASFGPFHLQSEYFEGEIDVDNGTGTTIEADGYYVQAGYVLTGENRRYKTGIGAFDSVKPASEGGAWELFARFDSLDLSNAPPVAVAAEKAESLTLGVNWYLNALVKLSANYVTVDTDRAMAGEDDGDALVARLQFAF